MKLKHLLSTATIGVTLACGTQASNADEARSAKILHHYTLPSFSLENIGVSSAELSTALANGLPHGDLPALGSGLQRLGGNYFLGVTDRGATINRSTPT